MILGFFRKTRGCLYGKTPQQKEDFFNSLLSFHDTDKMFFEEQFDDLLSEEKDEFIKWIAADNAHKRELLQKLDSLIASS